MTVTQPAHSRKRLLHPEPGSREAKMVSEGGPIYWIPSSLYSDEDDDTETTLSKK